MIHNRASQIFVRTVERGYSLTYFLCLEIGCAHFEILQWRFAAYKPHYINLNSSPIDWKSLFTCMVVGLVILILPAL
jgi:hypothetical protein